MEENVGISDRIRGLNFNWHNHYFQGYGILGFILKDLRHTNSKTEKQIEINFYGLKQFKA